MYRTLLAALDGSACSTEGARFALRVARAFGARLVLIHVHSDSLHAERFRDMEPGLPRQYQSGPHLAHLRKLHGSLILEGFEALSLGYLDELSREAQSAGVEASQAVVGGRHYVRLLELIREHDADLVVLGAVGVGATEGVPLGSTAARVLRHAPCDVLLHRTTAGRGPVLVGIDGSKPAYAALDSAQALAHALDRPLDLAAVYDPEFHSEVFRSMARALPEERQRQVGLQAQEGLHESLINDGLARLYQDFLTRAAERACRSPQQHLLKGKAQRELVSLSQATDASLLVVGRHGHHREPLSLLGFTAETAATTSSTSVLITASRR
jgi:nucleotide-binding universal stress UspA family protein